VSQPIEAFKNSFKIPELKQRIIFTVSMLAIYRLGAHVPTPGVDGRALSQFLGSQEGGFLQFYDLFAGGAFSQATIFALGIMPYITASIIMSLLVVVVPALEALQKQGAEGQKKINDYTRYGTILLCIVQSLVVAGYLKSVDAQEPILMLSGVGFYLMCILTFTTGTAFIMWLGERISEHGVGNGISLIIFTSIISSMPAAAGGILSLIRQNELNLWQTCLMAVIMIIVIAGTILITTGQRRIPVQYPKQVRGQKVYGGGRNYLPLRVNQAGVIPIIFASSILMLPSMMATSIDNAIFQKIFTEWLAMDGPLYNIIYAALIMFFCFFYTAIIFNPIEMADNMKKHGSVIMGVRPGRATAEYLHKTMTRITLVGSVFLVIIALIPTFVNTRLGIQNFMISSFFGGTSLLILVGVALDTVKQMEQHLIMRNYDGFSPKGGKIRSRRG
jgi:preprotein translocase subunit SecY